MYKYIYTYIYIYAYVYIAGKHLHEINRMHDKDTDDTIILALCTTTFALKLDFIGSHRMS